ncbi:MAG TPA: alpha/beta fold hydrolase [Paludibacteraceae bacterium]|nr:alpha/beta fold hydrolase [Paludibacteraceae bacterium]
MEKVNEKMKMTDGKEVAIHAWLPDAQPRYVVILCHGMNEFAQRYDDFGTFLTEKYVALYDYDQRGHGDTAGNSSNYGFLAEKDGFDRVVEDLHTVITNVAVRYPQAKLFLLGHSFGSFVSQAYMERFSKEDLIAGCLLSGTAGPALRTPFIKFALLIPLCIRMFKGARYRSKFMNDMVFGGYNSKFENSQSKHAWLTRDAEMVKIYDADERCTFTPTVSFFCDLLGALSQIHKTQNMNLIPKELPVHLFFGSMDPVGDYGKMPHNLYSAYRSLGMKHVSKKEYEGGRHEMLNEINKEEVKADLLSIMERWNGGILTD